MKDAELKKILSFHQATLGQVDQDTLLSLCREVAKETMIAAHKVANEAAHELNRRLMEM